MCHIFALAIVSAPHAKAFTISSVSKCLGREGHAAALHSDSFSRGNSGCPVEYDPFTVGKLGLTVLIPTISQ